MIKTFCDLSHVIVLLALFAVELREEEVKAPVEGRTTTSERRAAERRSANIIFYASHQFLLSLVITFHKQASR